MVKQRILRSIMTRVAGATMVVAMSASPGLAKDNVADGMLKAMSAYMASLPHITLSYDSDIEVLTSDMQKIQFTSSGNLWLSRPGRLRSTRTGGYADVELVYDGATVTLHDRVGKAYAQLPRTGNVDQLVDSLREDYDMLAPGLDFLLSDPYAALTEGVLDAHYIGPAMVGGIECDHLAFRTHDTDWQIWIEHGAHPFVRKYVITSKTLAAAPQYTLRVGEWGTAAPPADAFTFRAAPDAIKVDVRAIGYTDEVPPGVVTGDKK